MAWSYMGEEYGTDYDLAYAMVRGGYLEESFKAWVNGNWTAYDLFRDVMMENRRTGNGAREMNAALNEGYATIVAENIEADVDEYEDDYGGVAVRLPGTEEEEDE